MAVKQVLSLLLCLTVLLIACVCVQQRYYAFCQFLALHMSVPVPIVVEMPNISAVR